MNRVVDDTRLTELEKEAGDRPVDSILELALAYDERGEFAQAAPLYRQAADQGVGVAELRLGWFNESGKGSEQSYTLARSHYERAAALGAAEANMRLGLLYLEGWGVTKNAQTAVADLRLAADAGYGPAQQILSQMYFAGTGVAPDLKEALVWAEKAAAGRNAEAQSLVGSIRAKAARLPGDIQSAREWFQLSAEQEYAGGMLRMATTFLKKGADPESIRLGVRWLELAADNGSTAGAFYLGGMYLTSPLLRNAPDHEEQARKFLTQSAEGGEYAAKEVLERAKISGSLTEAFVYVMKVPVEVRYIQRLAARPPTAWELAHHLTRPRPIKMVTPIYPAAMSLTKTEAEVVVEFVIDTTGRVRDAKCISSPHPAFAEPAVAAIDGWRFLPATKDGHAVNTRVRIPVKFRMGDVRLPNSNTPVPGASATDIPAGS
jgi:TonB family protein